VYLVPRLNVTGLLKPPIQIFAQVAVNTETVQVVEIEFTLKNTSSLPVGALAPPLPPELAAQLVVAVKFHVPVFPTQNLLAIKYP
jgi:hypothetical protein